MSTDEKTEIISEHMPFAEDIVFKPEFEERYKELLGEERYKTFIDYSLRWPRKCIRINPLKCSVADVKFRIEKQGWILEPVPWAEGAFWISHKEGRRDIGNLIEHALGYIYVQEPTSMLPPLALQPREGEAVLDMCASPGSKTTQMAMMMDNTGMIVANEMAAGRIAPLKMNLQRTGVVNTMISQRDGRQLTGVYDAILVDAPCSGVGTIRKSLKTINMWNPRMIKRLGQIQFTLLAKAYKMLRPGGRIVYSTCTLEPQENEAVVSRFLEEFPDMSIVPIDLPIVRSDPVMSFAGKDYVDDVKHCLRVWPMDNDTEGFFVSSFVKSK